jgi:hypothetical protein
VGKPPLPTALDSSKSHSRRYSTLPSQQ